MEEKLSIEQCRLFSQRQAALLQRIEVMGDV